jgi:hypothetical protein
LELLDSPEDELGELEEGPAPDGDVELDDAEDESDELPVLDFPSVEPDEELLDSDEELLVSDCIAFFLDSEG